MFSFKNLSKPIPLLFLAVVINSCAATSPKTSQDIYYTTPPVSFIRESPKYDSPNVAPVYRGDQVVVLSRTADDWCQVKTVQSGEIGWIQSPLLSAQPIPTPTYLVQVSKVGLQNTPQKRAPSPEVLNRGDKVRKLSENEEGWWLVLAEKDKSLGWLPATAVSKLKPEKPGTASPTPAACPSGEGSAKVAASTPPPPKQLYYVATSELNLHSLPLVSSQVVNTLKFNDRVEKIGQSNSQWIKVRYPVTGAQGWAQGFFLADAALKTPKELPQPTQKKRTRSRRPVCPKPAQPEKAQPKETEPVVL
jgi:uncharacterized protein YgiM (DUF1202 family)